MKDADLSFRLVLLASIAAPVSGRRKPPSE